MSDDEQAESTGPTEEDLADRKQLAAYREQLVVEQSKAGIELDKTIIGLSGGALVITITFISDAVTEPSDLSLVFLACSWGAFGLSLASVAFASLHRSTASRRRSNSSTTALSGRRRRAGCGSKRSVWGIYCRSCSSLVER